MSCDNLKDAHYIGSESQWKRIKIDSNNKELTNAIIHYEPNAPTIEPTPTPIPTNTPTTTPTVTPSPTASPDSKPKFTDVKGGAYYYDAVIWAVEKGITSGTSKITFSPDKPCTRGQIVTFLWNAKGKPEPASTVNPFKDVKAGDYYYKAVLWAKEKGITSGTDATHFSPSAPCTRGQAMTFLWNSKGNPTISDFSSGFSDVKSGQYYTEAVKWAVRQKITSGTSPTTFSPSQQCTRGQIVTFLYRADG